MLIWDSGEQCIPISTAPAVEPAMIERNALGLSFFLSSALSCCAVAIARIVVVDWAGFFEAMTEI